MPIRPLRALFLFAALSASAIPHAFADTVTVSNGDRLAGKIIRKSGDTLILQTDYAGELKIQWSKVVAITTEKKIPVQLDDGGNSYFHARLESPEPGKVSFQEEGEEPRTIAIGEVKFLNPLPEETRNGVTYKGRVNASYSRASGNTRNEAAYGETAFSARAREYRYELNAKAMRSSDNGRLTNSNWLVGGNYDKFLDPKHFLYTRASVEHDEFKGIDQRDVVGGGYGWQLVDTPQTQFSVRGGLDYVNIRHTLTPNERYPSAGWGIKASHKLESYRAELFHEQDGFVDITDVSHITIRTRSGLRVPLMAGITATSQLNVDWEHTPQPGRKPLDSLLVFGLGYEW